MQLHLFQGAALTTQAISITTGFMNTVDSGVSIVLSGSTATETFLIV